LQLRHNITGHSNQRSDSGFTIVEIVIVLGLIALLAAIAVPNLIRTRAAAARSTCINNLRQIDSAMQQWALEQKKPGNSAVDYSDIGPYLRDSVACPAGGTSLADSYIVANMATEPSCRISPLDHFIPQIGVDRVTLPNGNDGTGVANNNGTTNPPTTPGRPAPPRRNPHPTPPNSGGNNGNGGGNGNGTP
jgi:prepilin-type N-terminal cleavage/methylation domain-containing protein